MIFNDKFLILDIYVIKNKIIQISIIKIFNNKNKFSILEKKNYFIKNDFNYNIYKNTKITNILINTIGVSIDFCIDSIYKFSDNLDIYIYGNLYEFSKYLKEQIYVNWYKKFKDLRLLYNLLDIDTNLYSSGNIYKAFNLEMNEIKYNSLWNVYSLYKSLYYINKKLNYII